MTIPVVAFTASRNPRDHQQTYECHANCCFLKPDNLQGYLDLVCYLAESTNLNSGPSHNWRGL